MVRSVAQESPRYRKSATGCPTATGSATAGSAAVVAAWSRLQQQEQAGQKSPSSNANTSIHLTTASGRTNNLFHIARGTSRARTPAIESLLLIAWIHAAKFPLLIAWAAESPLPTGSAHRTDSNCRRRIHAFEL